MAIFLKNVKTIMSITPHTTHTPSVPILESFYGNPIFYGDMIIICLDEVALINWQKHPLNSKYSLNRCVLGF